MRYSLLYEWASSVLLTGKEVERVSRSTDSVVITFKDSTRLHFVIDASDAFMFLQKGKLSGSDEPLWLQLKHAVVISANMAANDRILRISMEQKDLYQQTHRYVLIAELGKPRANMILTSVQNGTEIIIDALHKYTYADNPQRQVLPRLPYEAARTTFVPSAEVIEYPLTLKLPASGEVIHIDNVNDYFIAYYEQVLLENDKIQARQQQARRWQKELAKATAKLRKQSAELKEAEQGEKWYICAETIKQNLQTIKPGQLLLSATNYFDNDLSLIDIPLFADKGPLENMNHYIRKFKKAKNGLMIITANLQKTSSEIQSIKDILARIESGESIDLLSGKGSSLEQTSKKLSLLDKLLNLKINADFEIIIGRKASENDFVTTQLGRPHDWWFHTRIYHGAHVLLRNFHKKEPTGDLIRLCCSLAAWYSKAKFSSNVPVDYTQIRFVRKPRKSAPGYVTYTNHHTFFASPMDIRAVREELKL